MKHLFLLTTGLLLAWSLQGARYFSYSPSAREAYEKVTSLRLSEAAVILQELKRREPDNLIIYHLENYADFFHLYISEDETLYKEWKHRRQERLEAVQAGDPESPYYLFVQADIRLQWAAVKLKFDEYIGAFLEINKAHNLLRENQKRFPGFMPNLKDLAILHAMVGTIPDNYLWGVKLLSGLEGTIAQGRREMEKVLEYGRQQPDFIFHQESEVLYAYLLLHLANDEEGAWQAIRRAGLEPASNPLHCFLMSNIAMHSGRNDRAITLLSNRPRSQAFMDFPYLHYMLGIAKLRRLDPDAGAHFQTFLQVAKGQNYIREAYQKLAWHELINQRPEGYRYYIRQCLTEGQSVIGGDKSAEREALENRPPHLALLKARLLFDGSYYQQAWEVLNRLSPDDYPHSREQLEHLYRMGRILHGLKKYPEALSYYQQTLEKGRNETYFFACNAALQAGLIYEKLGDTQNACLLFETCLRLQPSEYRAGLHQKAKSGLSRLK